MHAFKRVSKLTFGKVWAEWAKQCNFSTGLEKRSKYNSNGVDMVIFFSKNQKIAQRQGLHLQTSVYRR